MRRIKRRESRTDFADHRVSPVLRRVFAARGVQSYEHLQYRLQFLPDPRLMQNMDAAVSLLIDAMRDKKRLLVIGDYDADGATSTALAIRALRAFGAEYVEFLVPDRFKFGYGLTPEIVALAQSRQPHLIITVDNGISSHAGVAAAQAAGIKVLITDHHLPPRQLPSADVILNPNLNGDLFPGKCIAGVGVVFFLMVALRGALREQGWFRARRQEEPNMAQWLDLVALGTVADVVPLDYCNRILVAQGLARIGQGQCAAGITALLKQAQRLKPRITTTDLGFGVGPRLNAAGRLQDMSIGIECLLTDDENRAADYAQQLDALNRERREIESGMAEEAYAAIEDTLRSAPVLAAGVCLFEPHWHQGVIGIVASRIKERFHRPAITFAPADEHELKGSGRSIEGVHLRDVLDAVACKNPGLITKFGGHAMAAGMSLAKSNFEAFKRAFIEEVENWVSQDQLQGTILSDGELTPHEFSFSTAQALEAAGPWGQGFAEPSFDGVFEVRNRKVLKDKHLKLAMRLPGGHAPVDAILFNYVSEYGAHAVPAEGEAVQVVYGLDLHRYMERQQLQMRLQVLLRDKQTGSL